VKQSWNASQFNEYLGELNDGAWVIYSNLSGALIELNKGLYDILTGDRLEYLTNSEHIELLSTRGVIVPKGTDEVSVIQNERNKHQQNVTAIGLQIIPTLFCNFACSYCYEQSPDKMKTMSTEIMDAIIAHLGNKIRETTRYLMISWFGGEPLLALDCIQYLSKSFLKISDRHSLQYFSSIVTNAYLLNRQNITSLIKNRVTSCQVTLDGPPHIHDQRRTLKNGGNTWHTIVRNLCLAADKGMQITVRMNVDKSNIAAIEDLVSELDRYNLTERVKISIGVVSDVGITCRSIEDTLLSANEAEEILKQKKIYTQLDSSRGKLSRINPDFFGCVATAKNSIIIGPEGELYKCTKVVGNPNESCGSIFYPDEADPNLEKWELCDNLEITSCKKCSKLPICKGLGCPYDSAIKKKNIFDCDREKLHKNYRNQLIRYYRQRTKKNHLKKEKKHEIHRKGKR